MKKLFLLLFCLPLFIACSDSEENSPTSSEKTIAYKFNAKTTPTGDNNLIGVQVYKGTKGKGSELAEYAPYAYGVFDDFSKIKLDFPKEYDYKIVSTVIVDGKLHVAQDANGYLKPFSIDDNGVPLTNTFIFDSSKAMTLLNQSTTTLSKAVTKSSSDSQDFDIPALDRYYGETIQYDGASKEDPIVDMDRYVFGIRLNVEFEGENIKPNDCILLTVDGSNDTIKIYASDEIKSIERVYTFSHFTKEETPRSTPLKVFHQLPENGELRYFSEDTNEMLYRNDLMILNQTVVRTRNIDSYPFKWEGIGSYYGDRGI